MCFYPFLFSVVGLIALACYNELTDRVANGGKLVHVLQEEESVLFNEEGNRSSPHCIFKLPLHDSGGEVKRFASQIDKYTSPPTFFSNSEVVVALFIIFDTAIFVVLLV